MIRGFKEVSPALPSGEWRTAQITIGNTIKEAPPAPSKMCTRCREAIVPEATNLHRRYLRYSPNR